MDKEEISIYDINRKYTAPSSRPQILTLRFEAEFNK